MLAGALTVAGLGLLAASVAAALPVAFVASAVVAGSGVGTGFRSALGVAGSLAEPGRRGEVLAGMFLVAYVGLAVPVLLLGAALTVVPLDVVVVAFSAVTAALVAVSAPALARRATPARPSGLVRTGAGR